MRRLQCNCTMEKDRKHKGLEVDLRSNGIILQVEGALGGTPRTPNPNTLHTRNTVLIYPLYT